MVFTTGPPPLLVPPELVMVSGQLPAGVDELVTTESVEEVVIGLGEKVAVAPLGRPLTLRVSALLNPFTTLMPSPYVAVLPAVTEAEEDVVNVRL
jgi:hypothetical protein